MDQAARGALNQKLASWYLISGIAGWVFVDATCVVFTVFLIVIGWKLYKILKGVM